MDGGTPASVGGIRVGAAWFADGWPRAGSIIRELPLSDSPHHAPPGANARLGSYTNRAPGHPVTGWFAYASVQPSALEASTCLPRLFFRVTCLGASLAAARA